MTDDGYKYDVFLSFNDADATVVREVAVGLRSEGLRVSYIDHASRTLTELAHDIETALDQSRVMLLFMSRNSLSDQWSQLEKRSFKFRDPSNKERRFVPVRLDETVLPANLRQVEFIEWPNENPEAVLSRLVAICKPPLAKPTSRGIGAVRTSPKKRYKMAPTALVRTFEFSTEGKTAVYGTRSGDICQIDIEKPATVTQLRISVNVPTHSGLSRPLAHEMVLRG